jgi:hypothetical protein
MIFSNKRVKVTLDMNTKRKAVQDYIIKYVGAIVAGNENTKLYQDLFDRMTDEEFDRFMVGMKEGKIHISIVVPNDGKTRVSVENNFRVAKQLGHEFFQRVKVTNHPDYPDHMLPIKALTMILPIRRAQQLLSKKISIPEHSMTTDVLTGQVAGKSRSSKLTYPEQQMLIAMDMKDTATEMVRIRGGDLKAQSEYVRQLANNGEVSQKDILDVANLVSNGGVVSTRTLKYYLQGMHIKNTL